MENDEGPSKNKQTGIFSSPDLSVDVEKIAARKATHPTPIKERPQTGKKKWVAIVIAIAVIAGAIALTVALSIRQPSEPNLAKIDSASLEESLNRYINYLVYGDNNSSSLADASLDPYESKLYTVMYSNNENTATSYFNESEALLNTFLQRARTAYPNNATPEEEILIDVADNNLSQLTAIKDYALMEQFDMLNAYPALGAGEYQRTAHKYFDNALQSSNDLLREAAESKMKMAESIATIFSIYDGYGCIKNKALDESCTEQIPWTEEMLVAQDAFVAAQGVASQNGIQLLSNLFSGCEAMLEALEAVKVNNQTEQ